MEIRGLLNSTAFFNVVLDARQLDALAAAARTVEFRRGDTLMRQGEIGTTMYLIAKGKVSVLVHQPGGDKTVATLGPGEVVGEMAVITGERRTATAKAKGSVSAVEITKEALTPLLSEEPRLAERFATVVEQRHAELASRSTEARRWLSVGQSREQITARMTAYYSG